MKHTLLSILVAVVFLLPGGQLIAGEGGGGKVTLTGRFTVTAICKKKYEVVYGLEVTDKDNPKKKKHFKLKFGKEPSAAMRTRLSGSVVKVRGSFSGGALQLADARQGASGSLEVLQAAEAAATTGTRKVLLILANYSDKNLGVTPAQIEPIVFTGTNSANKIYRGSSYDTFGLGGIAVGPFTSSYATTDMATQRYNIAYEMDDLVTAAGYNLADYQSRVYVFPSASGLGYAAIANINGPRVWFNGYWNRAGIHAHELGHNVGMHHAAAGSSEYGDASCFMGGAGIYQANAPHRYQMGWIPAANVVSVTSSGTYTVYKSEVLGSGPLTLKVRKGVSDYYWFSYRMAVGLDANLSSTYLSRTSVHSYRGSGAIQTSLKTTLGDGSTFSDTAEGVSVTQVSHNADSVTLSVTITANQPPVAVAAASPTGGFAPLVVAFSGTGSSDPDGTISSYSWNFGDGSSGGGATPSHTYMNPGTYTATLTVTDNRGDTASDTVAIAVEGVNAPSGLVASVSGSLVTLMWTDNSDSEQGFYVERGVKKKGKIAFARVGTLGANVTTFSETLADGTYRYRVQAFNGTKVSGYSSEVQASVGSKKGGGGGGGKGGGKPPKKSTAAVEVF